MCLLLYAECPEKKQVPKETVSCESECAVNYDISNAVGIQEIKPLAQLELLKVDKYDAERSIEIKNETAATQNTEETFTSNMFDAERLVKDLESTGRESELCSIKEKKKKPRKAKEKPETSVEIITSSEVEGMIAFYDLNVVSLRLLVNVYSFILLLMYAILLM